MIEEKRNASTYVFGLDIGTRSIVGTVGYRNQNRFIVVAQRVKEHDTRAMLDGQIHDIQKDRRHHPYGETGIGGNDR